MKKRPVHTLTHLTHQRRVIFGVFHLIPKKYVVSALLTVLVRHKSTLNILNLSDLRWCSVLRMGSCYGNLGPFRAILFLLELTCIVQLSCGTPFIVQSLSSRYAIILGGYGPGYRELKDVEVVKHDRICKNAIRYD